MQKIAVRSLLLVTLVLGGCATTPNALKVETTSPLQVSQVQKAPQQYVGQQVRWGGTILKVTNAADVTTFEILGRPLGSNARPDANGVAQGRFLATLKGFADPAQYPEGRLMTVVGTLQGPQERKVGEFPYVFPVVAIENQHLWPETKEVDPYPYPYYYPPYFYDPFYYPYYGPGPLFYPRPYPYRW